MDCLTACYGAIAGLFCSPPQTKLCPPDAPKATDPVSTIWATNTLYLDHLTTDSFTPETHSLFAKRETTELFEIDDELKRHVCCSTASRICCCFARAVPSATPHPGSTTSPWLRACCTSREGRFAMGTGFGLGCLAGQVTLFCTAPTIMVSVISGVIAGLANCGGTYFTLVDNHKRMEALVRKKEIHAAFRDFYNSLAVYLLKKDALERRSPPVAPVDPEATIPTSAAGYARTLLARKSVVLDSFAVFFSAREEARYAQGGMFDQFFQVCSYLTNRDLEVLTDGGLQTILTSLNNETDIMGLRGQLAATEEKLSAHEAMLSQMRREIESLRRECPPVTMEVVRRPAPSPSASTGTSGERKAEEEDVVLDMRLSDNPEARRRDFHPFAIPSLHPSTGVERGGPTLPHLAGAGRALSSDQEFITPIPGTLRAGGLVRRGNLGGGAGTIARDGVLGAAAARRAAPPPLLAIVDAPLPVDP